MPHPLWQRDGYCDLIRRTTPFCRSVRQAGGTADLFYYPDHLGTLDTGQAGGTEDHVFYYPDPLGTLDTGQAGGTEDLFPRDSRYGATSIYTEGDSLVHLFNELLNTFVCIPNCWPAMGTSPYESNILEWDEKIQTNTQTNKQKLLTKKKKTRTVDRLF